MSALHCYYNHIVLRFVWFSLVCDNFVWWFIFIYTSLKNRHKQQQHFICHCHQHGWVYIVDNKKYSFKVCVISLHFYSTHYKVYFHLPFINTQRWTTAPFDITHVISSSNWQTPILYQRSANCCEGYDNSNIISLLQPYQKSHYCNQSVLAIVQDLNIFGWSIIILISFWESPWYINFLLHARYLYDLTGIRFYIFVLIPELHLSDHHCHGWVHCIVTTTIFI